MKILAHRGSTASGAIENTIAAFQQALLDGADGIETDVRLTLDSAPVIIHDRVAGDDHQAVASLTHAELESAVSHRVPLLDDIIQEVEPTFCNIEIKARDAVDACCAFLDAHSRREWLVTSFDHRIVCEVAERTSARCGVLTGHWIEDVQAFLCQFQRWSSIDTVVWNYDFVDPEQLQIAKGQGFQNYVWNALNNDDIRRCAELSADGMIVDDVAAAIKIVRHMF